MGGIDRKSRRDEERNDGENDRIVRENGGHNGGESRIKEKGERVSREIEGISREGERVLD